MQVASSLTDPNATDSDTETVALMYGSGLASVILLSPGRGITGRLLLANEGHCHCDGLVVSTFWALASPRKNSALWSIVGQSRLVWKIANFYVPTSVLLKLELADD